jgi:hypothetical protein
MVMAPTPSLDDLLWFFEVEPRSKDDDWQEYWPYTEVTYSTRRGEWECDVSIWPGGESVQLKARRAGDAAISLNLKRVVRVDLEPAPRREALRIHFRPEERLDTLWLQLEPTFALSWEMAEW